MPGATLPNTGITVPALGDDPGDWDDLNNACWENYDEHDHTEGAGLPITVAALDIDDDLSFGGHSIEGLGSLEFAGIAELAAGAMVLYVDEGDGELYYRNADGVNGRITLDGGIDGTLLGGIVGDYAAIGAEVAYDDANDTYTFKQEGSPGPWARVSAGSVRIYEFNTTESVYVSLKAPAALGASYDITFPVALPGSQKLLQIEADGDVVASNVLPADTNIDLSGTGDVKHGDRVVASDLDPASGVSGDAIYRRVLASATAYIPLKGLRNGLRLKKVRIDGVVSVNPTSLTIYTQNGTVATARPHSAVGGLFADGYTEMTLTTPYTFVGATGTQASLKVVAAGGSDVDVYSITLTYDNPT